MNRTVEITLSDTATKQGLDIRSEQFQTAIGYLSLWGIGAYPIARIHIFLREEMSCCYSNSGGGGIFIIGAIYRDGKWEFNS